MDGTWMIEVRKERGVGGGEGGPGELRQLCAGVCAGCVRPGRWLCCTYLYICHCICLS